MGDEARLQCCTPATDTLTGSAGISLNIALIEVTYKAVGASYKHSQAEHTPSLVHICGVSVCILPNAKTLAHQSVHGKDAACIQQHAQLGTCLCFVLQCKIA